MKPNSEIIDGRLRRDPRSEMLRCLLVDALAEERDVDPADVVEEVNARVTAYIDAADIATAAKLLRADSPYSDRLHDRIATELGRHTLAGLTLCLIGGHIPPAQCQVRYDVRANSWFATTVTVGARWVLARVEEYKAAEERERVRRRQRSERR